MFVIVRRDLVHRQTAMAAIGHLTLGVYGFGCEDALVHLLNYLWPNVFETSPHVVQAFMSCIEGMRIGLGPSKLLQYALQVGTSSLVFLPAQIFPNNDVLLQRCQIKVKY